LRSPPPIPLKDATLRDGGLRLEIGGKEKSDAAGYGLTPKAVRKDTDDNDDGDDDDNDCKL
jgi:hypothetical protein